MNMTHQESEQPMKFIKLTTIHGNELFVLPHEIRRMFRHLGKGQTQGTQIVMKRRGKDDSVDDVRETPEQILAQIGGGEPSVEINAPKVANPFNWVGATHPMTWPCVRCNKNHEVPSRGFMCPACVEAMDKEFDLELRHDDPRNVEALKKASNP